MSGRQVRVNVSFEVSGEIAGAVRDDLIFGLETAIDRRRNSSPNGFATNSSAQREKFNDGQAALRALQHVLDTVKQIPRY